MTYSTKQLQYVIIFSMDHGDSVTVKTEYIMTISYDLYGINIISIRIDICKDTEYNSHGIGQIGIKIVFYGIILLLTLFLDTLTILFDIISPITMEIDICNSIGYRCDTVCHITIRINVYGIRTGMTSIVNILIKVSILTSILVAVTIIIDIINSNLNKISDSECGYDNSSNVTGNNQTTRVAPIILYKLFRSVGCLFY